MPGETVLVVEDDEDLVHMLEYNLKNRGYRTLTALNGFDAWDLIESEKPHLILLDIMLPGINGWQICETLRKHQQTDISQIPIIMLTALSSPEEKLKGIRMGADDYIPKPFSIKEVLLKIHRLIERDTTKKALEVEVDALKTKESQLTDFQDMLFHELKNQLTIIGGYSRRIKEAPVHEPERYHHYSNIIHQHSHALYALVDQILLLTRLTQDNWSLPVEKISMEQIIRNIITVFAAHADNRGIKMHFEKTENVADIELNPTAVRLALSNLVENALKYSPRSSEITVRLGKEDDWGFTVDVQDSGPGIPEHEKAHIFDKFYRGKKGKNQTKGCGLGLYISKTLIESMGGTLCLLRNNKPGSCFRMTFHPPEFQGSGLALH